MTNTRSALLVARRELIERSRSKAFLISNLVILLALIAGLAIPAVAGDDGPGRIGYLEPGQQVADAAAGLAAQFGTDVEIEMVADEAAAEARLDAEDEPLDAVVVSADRVLVQEGLSPELEPLLAAAVRTTTVEGILEDAELSAEQREALRAPPELDVVAVEPPEEVTEGPALAVAAIAVFGLYGLLLFYGQFVAQGIVQEKSSRVIEILLSAVRPTALLYGKIIGLASLGILQTLLFAIVGVGAATILLDLTIPTEAFATVVLAVAWFLLGFVMYAAVFAVSASLVSRQEDLQATIFPAMIPIIGAFFVAQATLSNPDSTLSLVASLVPFTAPLVQPLRYGAQVMDLWEIPVAIVLCLATIAVLVPAAGRLYSGSALRFGGRVGLGEAWRGARR